MNDVQKKEGYRGENIDRYKNKQGNIGRGNVGGEWEGEKREGERREIKRE